MENAIHSKYLIANEQDLLWGLTVNTVGYQQIKVGETYPPQRHPTRYLFSTVKGRVLEEYQLLYITQGKGSFTSDYHKRLEIKEGNMFLLFPGEWHTYKPEKETGWVEYWIGFKGVNIDNRIEEGFFNKQKSVFTVGIHGEIVQLYKQAISIAQEQKAGYQQMLAGIVNLLLGYTYSFDKHFSFKDQSVTNQINKAKLIILDNFHTDISPELVAHSVNMGYSWFRRVFKQYTGFAPAQYILELRIQRSKELLTNTGDTIKEISFESGFDNPDYFCTVFKKKTNMTPVQYREFTQGKNL